MTCVFILLSISADSYGDADRIDIKNVRVTLLDPEFGTHILIEQQPMLFHKRKKIIMMSSQSAVFI